MDNYDLSNLPLLGYCADLGEHHPWLTDEENGRMTFSGRSVTVTTTEQAERQQLPSTSDEHRPEQRVVADFEMSLASNILEPLIVDDPEDPFAALAAYQSLTFEDDPRHSFGSKLGFFEGFSAESLPDVLFAEPEGNDFLELSVRSEQLESAEQPEQSQDELDAKGISIPESANPDTVSGKRRVPERTNVLTRGIPKSFIEYPNTIQFHKSLRRSKRLTKKRQKLDSTATEIVPLTQGVVTRSRFVTQHKRSASSEQATDQNPNESLKERIKKETEKWLVISKDGRGRKRYQCGYPDCGRAATTLGHLKIHIFAHIHISEHKCHYPECAKKCYFRDATALQKHVQSKHTHIKLYHCTLCDKRFGRLHSYVRHVRKIHKIAV